MNEGWRTIADVPYEVSSLGRVRRVASAKYARRAASVLRPSLSAGYEHVVFSVSMRRTSTKVHALVAAAFIGPRPKGLCINHRDGNKRNNCVDNLEYVSPAENTRHAIAIGLYRPSRRVPGRQSRGGERINAKLTDETVRQIRTAVATGVSRRSLARVLGVSPGLVGAVARNERWRHVAV